MANLLQWYRKTIEKREQKREHQRKFGDSIKLEDYLLLMVTFPDAVFTSDLVFIPKGSRHRYVMERVRGEGDQYTLTFRVFDREQEDYVTSTVKNLSFTDILDKLKNYETGNYRFVYRPSLRMAPMGDPQNY